MCNLFLIYFFFIKIFISVQKCITDFVNISTLYFFSDVVKCIRPTYGSKETPSPLNLFDDDITTDDAMHKFLDSFGGGGETDSRKTFLTVISLLKIYFGE